MRRDPWFSDRMTAPVFSVSAPDTRMVLYVGKATAGDWPTKKRSGDPIEARISERREAAEDFPRDCVESGKYTSAFWTLAKQINELAADRWRLPLGSKLQHVAWTNMCKIGAKRGNPGRRLFDIQRDLAVKTLRQEVKVYRPELIWFVTWDYGREAVMEVLDDPTEETWDKSGNCNWIWRRSAEDGLPAAVLSRHPLGAPRELVQKWLLAASELSPSY